MFINPASNIYKDISKNVLFAIYNDYKSSVEYLQRYLQITFSFHGAESFLRS
jgi:hypothetical protein